MIKDGFINIVKKLGSSRDITTNTNYNYSQRITLMYERLNDLYSNNFLASKAIDIPIDDAMREGRSFEDEKIKEYYISLDEKINQALKYARIFGGSALIVITKNGNLNEPLTNVKKDDIYNIAVVDATQLRPQSINNNPLEKNYLKSEFYNVLGSNYPIHESRVCYVDGVSCTNKEREKNFGFGLSLFEQMYKPIQNAAVSSSIIMNLLSQSNIDVVKIQGFNDAIVTNEEAVQKRISAISDLKSILNTIAVDSEDDFVNISKNFAGINDVQMGLYQIVASAADIPFTRFMSKSADGQNATGEGDLKNYYNSIKSKVQPKLSKIYNFLDPIVNSHINGKFENFDYSFKQLWQMSEKEKVEIDEIKSRVLNSYVESGILTEDAVLEELQKEGKFKNAKLPKDLSEYEA